MTKINSDIFGENAPEIIKDLAIKVKAIARNNYGIGECVAESMGIDIALKVSEDWGGAQIYIPSNIAIKISQRDMEMYKKFNGFNHDELAKEFGCSVVWVYSVIRRVRKKMRDKQQPQLPL